MARKDLVKIVKLNARTTLYILTSRGLQEKSHLTYHYIRQSFKQILKINQALDWLLSEQKKDELKSKVLLCRPADEITEILTRHLKKERYAAL